MVICRSVTQLIFCSCDSKKVQHQPSGQDFAMKVVAKEKVSENITIEAFTLVANFDVSPTSSFLLTLLSYSFPGVEAPRPATAEAGDSHHDGAAAFPFLAALLHGVRV